MLACFGSLATGWRGPSRRQGRVVELCCASAIAARRAEMPHRKRLGAAGEDVRRLQRLGSPC